jgi:hypothetical protein
VAPWAKGQTSSQPIDSATPVFAQCRQVGWPEHDDPAMGGRLPLLRRPVSVRRVMLTRFS